MICPQCHNEVPVSEAQYLSMFTCPKCTAVYFIDITGQPEFNDMSESEKYATEMQNQQASAQKATERHEPEQQYEPEYQHHESEDHGQFDQNLDQVLDQTLENSLNPQDVFETPSIENEPTDVVDLNSDQNPFQGHNQLTEAASVFSGVAQEISDFGNQVQQVQQISYDLKVTGLDSKEISSLFKEALEDMKLGWLPQDVRSFIKNGECHLTQLSPVQAFIIAKRIQFLDIEMKWTQNAIQ